MLSCTLGLDLGSVTARGVLLQPGTSAPTWTGQVPVRGKLADALARLLEGLDPGLVVRVNATGVGRGWLRRRAPAALHNEVVCLAEAAGLLCPGVRSLVDIGGHLSRWVLLGPAGGVEDFALSEACAAGSGAFIEQQASRLQLGVEELGRAAACATKAAPVAGRCTVFAKSDMIHLQQKGVPVEEIAAGLCRAVARTFVGSLLKGRAALGPVALLGGGASNPGLARAFEEMLRLPEPPQVPPLAGFFGALGAALLGATSQPALTVGELRRRIAVEPDADTGDPARLQPLEACSDSSPAEPQYRGDGAVEGYLGVDLGSVSTNFVVMSAAGVVLDGIYLPTRGRPLEVLAEGLQLLRGRFGTKLHVLGVGTTGSGRHLVAAMLGADVVHNEITCQLESALEVLPDCDTIIEIGGQDSKFIRCGSGRPFGAAPSAAGAGRLLDFTMNKICAAGTGSFLEEEAARLQISIIDEFAELALASRSPVDLGARCTVFMDTELVQAQARKVPVEDLCAGLAYAVARNYLERVVEGRSIGDSVVMQGGVASNRAVVAAFSRLLGRPVRVHPHNRISGAIGAALMARRQAPRRSAFRGLQALAAEARVRTFECPQCENHCQVSDIRIEGQRAHFGDACERYAARDRARAEVVDLPDLFAERDRRLRGSLPTVERPRAVLGLPLASYLLEQVPFWATLLAELRIGVRLSAASSSRTLEVGAAHLPAETCLPVKLAFGHARELLDAGVDAIWLPSLVRSTDWENESTAVCPFVQTLPFMLTAGLQSDRLLTPEVQLGNSPEELCAGVLPALTRFGVSADELLAAVPVALAAQRGFRLRLRSRGVELLKRLSDRADAPPRLALLGRPYTLADAFLNLNLGRHLHRLGALALPLEFLPHSGPDELGRIPWRYSRDLMRALQSVLRDPQLHPIVVGSYGCGPDAFAGKHAARRLGGRRFLELEFDEHRGEAGLITRLEAFLDEIAGEDASAPRTRTSPPLPQPIKNSRHQHRGRRVFVANFADHAYAVVGSFRAAGLEARLLPLPDRALQERAERCSSRGECHPYALLAADLERLAESCQAGDVYFIPGAKIPCLIQQYSDSMHMLLEKRGASGIELLSPDMEGYKDLFGYPGVLEFYKGLLAVDLLVRATCALRPYEREPGATDRAHELNLVEVQDGLAEGELDRALHRCVLRLTDVGVDRRAPRLPRVGIAGDIYTRVNRAANQRLYWALEELGCEVWPSAFLVDIARYGMQDMLRQSVRQLQVPLIMRNGLLLLWLRWASAEVESVLAASGARWEEPDFDTALDLAAPYIGRQTMGLLQWNVAKIVHFARYGASGVINAVGQNCMVGTISAAITRRVRADHDNMPLVTLFYGASESDSVRASLEAFAHQVKRFAGRRAGAARQPIRAGGPIDGRPQAVQ